MCENRLTGWLEPDGTFHECKRTEREKVAYELIGGQTAAFQSGWIACLNYDIACGFGIPAYREDCTPEQAKWLTENGYEDFLDD